MCSFLRQLAKMETIIKNDNPGYPFDYSFVDQEFGKLFKTETLIGHLAEVFFNPSPYLFPVSGYLVSLLILLKKEVCEIGIRKILRCQRAGYSRTAFTGISFARLHFLPHRISDCMVDDAQLAGRI